MITKLGILCFFVFISQKLLPKSPPAIEILGVCRCIGNQIPPHLDLLKFEIVFLEAEKMKLSRVDQSTYIVFKL